MATMSWLRRHFPADLCWFLTLVVIVRGGVLVARCSQLSADPDGYRVLARNVVEHGTLGRERQPTAYRPPLYPLLLTICEAGPWNSQAAIAALHFVLGLATVCLTVHPARRWQLAEFSYLAGGLVACDPVLLNQSTFVMTETLAAFLATLSLAAVSAAAQATGRRRVVLTALAGASFGLAALCRPTFVASLAFVAVALAWTLRGVRERLTCLATMLLAAALVVAPWAVRNDLRFNKPIVTTTHGGYTLLLGNNADYYDFLRTAPWRAVWHADRLNERLHESRLGDEVAEDRREYELAWQTIREQPAMFVYASLLRLGALWGVLPHATSDAETAIARMTRYATAVWYLAVFFLAVVATASGTARMTASPWLFAAALAASFTLVHLAYWTDLRMRAPLMPAIALLAAAGAKRAFFGMGRARSAAD
ncbi:MAG: hypothetical protein B7Z73_03760 [Planctomycetia bacterium 21-64-5]|nr:MAG: hypothetical protein B7Z73_03760 [Planctomycetia bacterium 21-64-5]